MRLLPGSSGIQRLVRLCLLIPSLSVAAPAATHSGRPNFLFICTDDQRFDALGVVQREQGGQARFPWFKSPNMDRLAAEGVRFRNAFVTSSLCSPSRAVFLTGRYNHLNGVTDNHTIFPTDSVTHATLLRAAGYKTAYIGKWHMYKQRGQRPGFDFSASYIAHGRYENCPFEINGVEQPTQGWVDDVATDYAIEFMRTNRSGPFLLAIGFKSPHGPCLPPARLKDAFAGERCRPAINEKATPPYFTDELAKANPAVNPSLPDPRLDYFRCLAGADENLGRLLNALDELGLAENTMVIYTSDNGYYLGDHGLHDKRSAYEESLRVPLLVRYPPLGRKGMLMNETVLNLDLASTIVDYAGLTIPKEMQGRSWRPLLERKSLSLLADWRSGFFYEYFFERNYLVPTLFAVRTDNAKLVQYPGHPDWTQVFDLGRDPFELDNLAGQPDRRALQARLEAEFERQARAVEFRIPENVDQPAGASASSKSRRAKGKTSNTAKPETAAAND
ncbi:MAG: sulfatase family protein [Verrucomicrobiota bacterium]